MSELNIGKIIEGEAARDAIHVAVAPVVAGEALEPGMHVAFDENGTVVPSPGNRIGIVDPFLRSGVEKGQKFYLFLYPKTVTNLRHDWAHPAFRNEPSAASVSMGWLQHFAELHKMTYNDLMEAVKRFVDGGCSFATIEDEFREWETPPEFWIHYMAVTGQKGDGNFFGCCI